MAKRSYQAVKVELSEAQQEALDLLLAGKSDRETGEALGVDRATVETWRTRDSIFIATMNRRRLDLWGSQVERLRGLVSLAVGVLESDLRNGDDPRLRQAAAVHILKAVKLYGEIPEPDNQTDESRIFTW